MLKDNVRARFVSREFRGGDTSRDFFAPTTGGSTSRAIDIYAVENGLHTFTFDASSAFLHVPESDLVIVVPPDVFIENEIRQGRRGDCFWRMRRTLYGRRSAAMSWVERISGELIKCGLERYTAIPVFSVTRNLRLDWKSTWTTAMEPGSTKKFNPCYCVYQKTS